MEDKYVLILGAGLMQRPAIEAAWEAGYKTLVVDANPKAVCASFADRFEPIDLKDKESLLKLAKSLGSSLAGVFTAGTDFSASVSYVAQNCSLPSHTYQAALNASDKILMRSCFAKEGVASPFFQEIQRSDIRGFLESDILDKMSYPKVVKPVDNMGARGCRLIRSKDEFLFAVEEAVLSSRSGRVILEDYMAGPEFSIDALVYKGSLTITGFADRHIFYPPYFIEMGHTMPSIFPEEKKMELVETFAKGIKALGLTCGAAKADIKYTEKGPMIGEIAARLSGGYMSGWTYPYASQMNLTKQALLIACGREPEELLQRRKSLPAKASPFETFTVPCTGTSAERAWLSIPGKVHCVLESAQTSAIPFVKNALYRASAGTDVSFPRNNVEKCGNVIALAKSNELAVKAAEEAVSSIVLRLEAPNPKTEAFIQRKEVKSESGFPQDAFVLPESALEDLKKELATSRIESNQSLADSIPKALLPYAHTVKDWNHRSIAKSLQIFDLLCPKHLAFNALEFYTHLLRAGIQGILYLHDKQKRRKTQ